MYPLPDVRKNDESHTAPLSPYRNRIGSPVNQFYYYDSSISSREKNRDNTSAASSAAAIAQSEKLKDDDDYDDDMYDDDDEMKDETTTAVENLRWSPMVGDIQATTYDGMNRSMTHWLIIPFHFNVGYTTHHFDARSRKNLYMNILPWSGHKTQIGFPSLSITRYVSCCIKWMIHINRFQSLTRIKLGKNAIVSTVL